MLTAILATAFLNLGSGPTAPIVCEFAADEISHRPMSVAVTPLPSLKDSRQTWRVQLELNVPRFNGPVRLEAAAQPIAGTDARDVLFRGISERSTSVSVGLREDGVAALSIVRDGESDPMPTRLGRCRNHEGHLTRWLSTSSE